MKKQAKPTSKNRREQEKLLALLCDGLSEEELGAVMAGALLVMDSATIDTLIKRLGDQTGSTLQEILAAFRDDQPDQEQPKRVGAAKILQEWKRAWREWDDCIFESGREEGRYRCQDHHWEEPYIDMMSVASDIDDIAGRLRPLATRVLADELDPEFSMAETFQQTIEEVGSGLPDYMDPWAQDGFCFDQEATRMLLEWEFGVSRRAGEPVIEAIRRVGELTVATKHLDLDDGAIAGFVRDLPKVEREAVTTELRTRQGSEPWKTALDKGWTWSHVIEVLGGKGKLTKGGRIVIPVRKRR